jgi:hypothetical protein
MQVAVEPQAVLRAHFAPALERVLLRVSDWEASMAYAPTMAALQ